MRYAISELTDANGHCSSTITKRFVFFTLSKIVNQSNGRMVATSITSASIPSLASSSAAPKATFIILLNETMVTSLPSLFTKHFPMGNTYSSSGTSPFSPYITSLSINITGSSSLIAAFNKPFASYGLLTEITFNPGMFAYILSKAVLC